jgi:hypothetical protein
MCGIIYVRAELARIFREDGKQEYIYRPEGAPARG